jgi:hypothetical protein
MSMHFLPKLARWMTRIHMPATGEHEAYDAKGLGFERLEKRRRQLRPLPSRAGAAAPRRAALRSSTSVLLAA